MKTKRIFLSFLIGWNLCFPKEYGIHIFRIAAIVFGVSFRYLLFANSFSEGNKKVNPVLQQQAEQWIQTQPVRFLENKGQMVDMEGNPVPFVLFKAEAPGMNMYITEKGIKYLFFKAGEHEEKPLALSEEESEHIPKHKEESHKIEWCQIDMELKGARIKKEDLLRETPSLTDYNYFYPHCSEGIYGVKQYEKITIKEIYPGIDWVLYNTSNKGFKYDFIVHPNSDPSQIQLIYSSLNQLNLNKDGSIEIQTKLGILTDSPPISYQNGNEIPSSFIKTLNQKNEHGGYDTHVQFSVGNYDKDQTLIIDPALTWATFYGGNSSDGPMSITTDNSGNIFIAGYIEGNFPLQNPGSGVYYDGTFGGVSDAFILKFTNTGTRLWATYYGGSGADVVNSISTDGNGNVFAAGETYSSSFPLQNPGSGAYYQPAFSGSSDAFILKFTNTGARLWATYYGGSGLDVVNSISIDGNGNIFVTGVTQSSNFPVQNPGGGTYYQPAHAGPVFGYDAFIVKFANAGVLIWATYYGGSLYDEGHSISADGSGNVFVTGGTSSATLPLQNPGGGAYFQPGNAGSSDAFTLKFTNTGVLFWATYYGGSGVDYGTSITTDGSGNVFVTGLTSSTNFPLQNPGGGAYYQSAHAGPVAGDDAFIVKFSNAGVLLWATYYGGSGYEYFYTFDNLVADACSNVYVSFSTSSADLPVQSPCDGAYQDNSYNGGIPTQGDIVLLKFSNAGICLWATYLGGDGGDFREALAVDGGSNLFITGEWDPGTNVSYPLTNIGGGSWYDATANGSHEGYICKFLCAPCDCGGSCAAILTVAVSSINPLCNSQCTGVATANPSGGTSSYTFLWDNGQSTQTATGLCAGTHTVTVTAASATTTAMVIITQPAVLTATVSSTPPNGTATAAAAGGSGSYTYNWSNGQTIQTATGLATGVYCCTITDANNCSAIACATLTIEPPCDMAAAGELFLPNGFSPNSDGANDSLKIYYGNMHCIKKFTLAIYDRWGEMILETADQNFKWDGKYDEMILNTQVLVYYLRVEFTDQTLLEKKGNISLVR